MNKQPEILICAVCDSVYKRRIKGMSQRKHKGELRPYRSITCSSDCSKRYTRALINKRNLLKEQWRIKNNDK